LSLEDIYSSSTVKLLKHTDRLERIRQGVWTPITLQLAPTDKCNLKCVFCSVAEREGDELDFKDIKIAILDLKVMGLKAVEITGGGDATLHPEINELIEFCSGLGIDLGMITNGVELIDKVNPWSLNKLQWLRISLNGLDYGVDLQIPKIKGSLSFSYIWNDLSEKDTLNQIRELAEKYGAIFTRIAPDCLSREKIDIARKTVPALIEGWERFFFQSKTYEKPKRCWYGYLKPFLAPDGYYYMCSANPLLERRFHPDFRMGRMGDEDHIWDNVRPRNTDDCGLCFFKAQNELIEAILVEVPHPNFV